MKKFSQLKQELSESGEHTFGGGFGDTFVHTNANSIVKDYDKGGFPLSADENLNRVNAFLNAYFKREFVDYGIQLGQLKNKLNIIGLDFDYDRNTSLREGFNKFSLNRFGGTFGKNIDTPHGEFERTNGFEEGVDYNLNMNVTLGENGLYRIEAKVVREASISGEETR
tara:strand:- start:2504 stop:3007 length:504 start_codon:yes stop_codon:yes gene_type:complete